MRPTPPSERRTVGQCELCGELARGGMATVHLGRWRGAGGFSKTVAVKALHAQYARDPEFSRMLLDEARMVARIRHPNVMPTLDLLEEHGQLYIVMEYVEGVTLACLQQQLAERGQHMPRPIALSIAAGVLHGLHAAHQATGERGEPLGLVHRDVSPENIMVGVDGFARLIDFGIAKALGRYTHTREGQVKGKLRYLAPEQLTGEPVDRRTDVYSAAVVLWQALAGSRLHRGRNLAALAYAIMRCPAPPPSALRPSVPAVLDRIVLRGLAKSAGGRWPTAEAMASALERNGPVAGHAQVGAWVRAVASRQLDERAALVGSSERWSTLPSPPGGVLAGARRRGTQAPDAAPPPAPSPAAGAEPFRRARSRASLVVAALLVAVLLVLTWLLFALWRSSRAPSPGGMRLVPAALPSVVVPAPPLAVASGPRSEPSEPSAALRALPSDGASRLTPPGPATARGHGRSPRRSRRAPRSGDGSFLPTDI